MGPKPEVFTFVQVRELVKMHEETLMNFFNGAIDRMDAKVSKLIEENTILKKEMSDLKVSMQFHSDLVEEKTKQVEEKTKEVEEKIDKCNIKENLQINERELAEKVAELEDRSRRNNLSFDGIIEEEKETWEESEKIVKKILKKELDLDPEGIEFERVHRSGTVFVEGVRNQKRTIVAKFLNFKDKEKVLKQFKEKKLWNKKLFINENFFEATIELRKSLFKRAKVLRERGLFAKVIYNKLISHEWRETRQEDETPPS